MRYEDISSKWFRLRLPRGVSYSLYESEAGTEDRRATQRLIQQMAREAPKTAKALFAVDSLPIGRVGIAVIDDCLSPEIGDVWAGISDPQDPDNDLKLNVSEFAVHLGESIIKELGGHWRYARSPNFFQSTVRVGPLEFLPFDAVMKRISDDCSGEFLQSKFQRFASAIEQTN